MRKFILSHLNGSESFKGEQIWSIKQILTWCRLHAYSPHYLGKHLLQVYTAFKGILCTLLKEATLSELFYIHLGEGSTLKEKNLLPLGANSFLLE